MTLRSCLPFAALALLAPMTAQAHDLTFRDLEFTWSGDERVDVARRTFAAELPTGTPIAQAEAVLRRADARCHTPRRPDQVTCTFSSQEAVEDHLHDVMWTVVLHNRDGKVAGLSIDRTSVGS
jgi:hypothetical protein